MNSIFNIILISFTFLNFFTIKSAKIIVIKNDYSCNPCFKKLDKYLKANKVKFYYNSNYCKELSVFNESDLFIKKNMSNGKNISLEKDKFLDSVELCKLPTPFILIKKNNIYRLINLNEIVGSDLEIKNTTIDKIREVINK